ncbi:hypothetical protein U1Q18_010715 [Sarracenia purpurea var. burkii]
MREYGVSASWTRVLVLSQDDFLFYDYLVCRYLAPVCFTKNGEVIIAVNDRSLVRYNPEEKTTKNLKNFNEDGFEWLPCSDPDACDENLVDANFITS